MRESKGELQNRRTASAASWSCCSFHSAHKNTHKKRGNRGKADSVALVVSSLSLSPFSGVRFFFSFVTTSAYAARLHCCAFNTRCLLSFPAPDTPKKASIVAASPTETRIVWEPVLSHTGEAVLYDVRLCDTSGPCDAANQEECAQFMTPNTSLDLSSAVANRRCLLIAATTQYAGQVLRSSPFVLETLVQIPTV